MSKYIIATIQYRQYTQLVVEDDVRRRSLPRFVYIKNRQHGSIHQRDNYFNLRKYLVFDAPLGSRHSRFSR
jgi:hypothetical protein